MDTNEIRTLLASSCGQVEHTRDAELNLSSILARGEWGDVPAVGVGGDRSAKEQISALVDAVHWCRERHPGASVLRLVIGEGRYRGVVFEALATLIAARRPDSVPFLEIMLDGIATNLPACPTFATTRVAGWMRSIERRLHEPEPKLVTALSAAAEHPSFRWYRGVTATYWSGRVEGLEVCRIDQRRERGSLAVGRIGKNGKRSLAGCECMELLADAPPDFTESDVISVARAVGKIVAARQMESLRDFQAEHRLEALVLRDMIHVPAGRRPGAGLLKPVFGKRPFQFPTQWCADGQPRYVDILMYEGKVPWVVELKDAKPGAGQYYRHAIGQAVLYREFVRKAPVVRAFLQRTKGLDATACRALVAFPEPKPIDPLRLQRLRRLAADFDVEVVPLGQVP